MGKNNRNTKNKKNNKKNNRNNRNNQVINDSEEVMGYVINPQAVNGENGDIIGVETPLGTVLNFKNQNLFLN